MRQFQRNSARWQVHERPADRAQDKTSRYLAVLIGMFLMDWPRYSNKTQVGYMTALNGLIVLINNSKAHCEVVDTGVCVCATCTCTLPACTMLPVYVRARA